MPETKWVECAECFGTGHVISGGVDYGGECARCDGVGGYEEAIPPPDPKPALEEVGTTFRGYTIFREPNEVGGHRYWSDEIGGGVVAWDTSLVYRDTLRLCLDVEQVIAAVQPGATAAEAKSLLLDPNAVHLMMLRGVIALPSVDQIRHIYGDRLKEGSDT